MKYDVKAPPGRKQIPVDTSAAPCGCGGFRPFLAVEYGDPFCSSACCRLAHGCPLPENLPGFHPPTLPNVEHGTKGYYRGCRCTVCRAESAAHRLRQKRAQRERLAA